MAQSEKAPPAGLHDGQSRTGNPMDKRYFYAKNAEGTIVAFIAFVPFLGKDGYMVDVTRHGSNAPGGVMETIIYEAFRPSRSEASTMEAFGVAPLAGLDDEKSQSCGTTAAICIQQPERLLWLLRICTAPRKIQSGHNGFPLHCLPSEASDSGYVLRSGKDPEPGRDPRGRSVFPEGKIHHEKHIS